MPTGRRSGGGNRDASCCAGRDGHASGASSLPTFAELPFSRLDYSIDLTAPTSPFVDETGAKHTFAEFKGKVLVYNIWAEWCGPCVLEMPSLARLQKAFEGKDVAVVPVAYGFGKDVTRNPRWPSSGNWSETTCRSSSTVT